MFISRRARYQNGAVLTEAVIALPVLFMFLFITCSMSLVTLKQNHIQEELQQIVREVTLSSGGYCGEIAEQLLRDKLVTEGHLNSYLSVTSTPIGDKVDLQFRVQLERRGMGSQQIGHEDIVKKYRVKIENPNGCHA